MPQLALTATFPLGTYYGHRSDGSVEAYPSPLRLHAALLSAAAQGRLSEDGEPSQASLDALQWLEKHPPNGIYQPETRLLNKGNQRIGYRDVGTFDSKSMRKKVDARPISNGVAVQSSYGYMWHDVPEEVAATLTQLAEDVPYLGESHSVVALSAQSFTPNLWLSPTANCFTKEAFARPVAAEGRTAALIANHRARFTAKPPTLARDAFKKSQVPHSERPTEIGIAESWYEPAEPLPEDAPWGTVYLFELDREVEKRDRVALALSMHKALIARLGYGAAPLITGKYNDGIKQPPNRLAIQYLPPRLAQLLNKDGPLLGLFVPSDATPEELLQVQRAVDIRELWSRRLGKIRIRFSNETRSGTRFWPAPEPGAYRLWETEMPIVPEVRRIRRNGSEWSLGDSALLSAAYVWRNDFTLTGSGPTRYIDLRDQAARRGVSALDTHAVTRHVRDFAHHSYESVPVQPYRAVLDLGDLAGSQAAVMLGQSRHLGGGLLRPLDINLNSSEIPGEKP